MDHMEANLRRFESLGLDFDDVDEMARSVDLEADDLLLLDGTLVMEPNSTARELSEDDDFDLWPEVDEDRQRVCFIGREAPLSGPTFRLARLLIENRGRPVSYQEIEDECYLVDTFDSTIRSLKRHLCDKLRSVGLGELADAIVSPRPAHYWIDPDRLDGLPSDKPRLEKKVGNSLCGTDVAHLID